MSTYTPEQVRKLTDAELCEALDKQRGIDITMNLELPTNYWFAPENWTKLQEELFIDTVYFEGDKKWFAMIPVKVYCRSDRLSRAVLEAALLCGQEA